MRHDDGRGVTTIYETEVARQHARTGLPADHLPVHRWYLRLDRPQDVAPPEPRGGVMVMRAERPTVAFYRFLYHTAGEDWLWGDRRRMSDDDLARRIGSETDHVMVLYRDGSPAGFYDMDVASDERTHIRYFALMPHAIGGGLGGWLLTHAIAKAGERALSLELDTCSLDHPVALENYRARGFEIIREQDEEYPDPRLDGTIRRDAAPHIPLAR